MTRDGWRERVRDFADNVRWLDCFRLSPAALARYHDALERQRPARLIAYASALAGLAEEVLARGWRPGYPTRCCVTGAERLMPAQRGRRAAFGRPVHARYGSRDAGLVAFQVGPEAARLRGGLGEHAGGAARPGPSAPTPPHQAPRRRHADAPLSRRRRRQFPAGSRPGHPVFTLATCSDASRPAVARDGRWVHGVNPAPAEGLSRPGVQLVQRPDYTVELHLVPKNGFAEDARRHRRDARGQPAGAHAELDVVDSIPRTKASKWRPVVSQVERRREARDVERERDTTRTSWPPRGGGARCRSTRTTWPPRSDAGGARSAGATRPRRSAASCGAARACSSSRTRCCTRIRGRGGVEPLLVTGRSCARWSGGAAPARAESSSATPRAGV